MGMIPTAEQRASKDPVMRGWVAAKDAENAGGDQAAQIAASQIADGTAKGPNTAKTLAGPYLNPDGSSTAGKTVTVPTPPAAPSAPTPPQNGTLQGPYLNPNTGQYQQGLNIVDGKPSYNQAPPPPPTAPASPGYDLDGITKTATDSINAQVAAQIAAYNQSLASGQQANNLAATQNTNYLTNALAASKDQHTLDTSNAQTIQNRRGGFYSGGLDYQLGSQDRAYTASEGSLKQDVQARNDDIYAKNALMATQAAENIRQLQDQTPAMIRQAIQDEIDRQRGINIQEAGITGKYNGNSTYQAQQDFITNNRADAALTGDYTPASQTAAALEMQTNSANYASATPAVQSQLHARNEVLGKQLGMTYNSQTGQWTGGNAPVRTLAGQNADRDAVKQQADLTGSISDGKGGYTRTLAGQTTDLNKAVLTGFIGDGKGGYVPTNAKQQQDLTNAWAATDSLGTVTAALSKLTGIPVGTPTQQAKNQAINNSIAQQNANTSSANSAASIANMNADNARADNADKDSKDNKAFAGDVAGELAQARSKQDVINFFNANAAEIATKLGIDAATKLKNDALAPYEDVSATDKQNQSIREKAITAAQKDFKWTNATAAERATMIADYEALFR